MTDFGIISTRSGVEVPDADNFEKTITSQHNTLKVTLSGSETVTLPGGASKSVSFDITHNLGYYPVCNVWAKHPSSGPILLPGVKFDGVWSLYGRFKNKNTNEITVTIYSDGVNYPGTNQDIDCVYWVYIDPRKDSWYE